MARPFFVMQGGDRMVRALAVTADRFGNLSKEMKTKFSAEYAIFIGNMILDESKKYVPRHMGDLEKTGRVVVSADRRHGQVSVVYGGINGVNYALAVHEEPYIPGIHPPSWKGYGPGSIRFAAGRGHKYLEKAVKKVMGASFEVRRKKYFLEYVSRRLQGTAFTMR